MSTYERHPLDGRMSMRFHVITSVWGDRHVDLFLHLTLPNVLSEQNLPTLARHHDVVYRIFTTPNARKQIESSKNGQRLAGVAKIEFMTPLDDRQPDVSWHVHWFHRAAAEAKVREAAVLFVPPDTLWTDGAFARMAELFEAGCKGIACPFILVSSETCVPDVRGRFLDASTGVLTVPATAMWPLARRHLHPLHALAIPGGPHARPAFELHWPVGERAMISRYAVRELVAFDPRRCPISYLWYADGDEDADGIHWATNSDEMLMLSVDPLNKYLMNYIIDHSCHPFDLARTTRHPLNDTRQTRVFASRSVCIHDGTPAAKAWRKHEMLAIGAGRDVMVARAAMMLHDALSAHSAAHMAGLLSVALHETNLARRWRHEGVLTVVVPADRAFSRRLRNESLTLVASGLEHELVAAMHDHVITGRLGVGQAHSTIAGTVMQREITGRRHTINGANVIFGPIELERIELFIVDRILARVFCSHQVQTPSHLRTVWDWITGRTRRKRPASAVANLRTILSETVIRRNS